MGIESRQKISSYITYAEKQKLSLSNQLLDISEKEGWPTTFLFIANAFLHVGMEKKDKELPVRIWKVIPVGYNVDYAQVKD